MSPAKRTPRLSIRGGGRLRASAALTAALAALVLAGCAQTRPQIIYEQGGRAYTFKRYERNPERDFFHHIFRKAYWNPIFGVRSAGPDQETLLEEWGQPDYVRRPFRALNGERVREWVYFDRRQIFQFIDDELIYEGPLTDFESLLLRNGYPDHAILTTSESNLVTISMEYRSIFWPDRLDVYNLTDGWIVQYSEGD